MTVLIISEPGQDGVFCFVDTLIRFLVGRGIQVHLAYSDRRSCDRLADLVGFVRQNDGLTLNLDIDNRPTLADVRALGRLRLLAGTVRPDLIHSHSSKAGALARVLPMLGLRVPQVYQPHAYAGMRPGLGPARFIYDCVERLLGHVGMTINVSSDEQAYAHRRLWLPHRRTIHIANGVDTTRFQPVPAAEKAALRRRFDLPARARILGTLGRASPQKDPLTLYHAFAVALAREPDLVLFHVGHGELDGELDRFIAQRALQGKIIRRPYLATPVDFYRAVDGFVLSSQYEGLSLAALEAMACDLPLILSDAPGNREFLKLPLTHLWTAPPGDVPAFARAIAQWAVEVQPAAAPSNHRTIAQEQFDSRLGLVEILSLYQRLLAEKRMPLPTSSSSGPRRGPESHRPAT
jgi:glycosyltransferase involved in cell wall biosynthesis